MAMMRYAIILEALHSATGLPTAAALALLLSQLRLTQTVAQIHVCALMGEEVLFLCKIFPIILDDENGYFFY